MSAPFRWAVVDDVIIAVAGAGVVAESDWDEFLRAVKETPLTRYLHHTLGNAQLSSIQRKKGFEVVGDKKFEKIVMVTDSALVRGIVTAASWFGIKVSSWRADQLAGAVESMGISPESQKRVCDKTLELVGEVSTILASQS